MGCMRPRAADGCSSHRCTTMPHRRQVFAARSQVSGLGLSHGAVPLCRARVKAGCACASCSWDILRKPGDAKLLAQETAAQVSHTAMGSPARRQGRKEHDEARRAACAPAAGVRPGAVAGLLRDGSPGMASRQGVAGGVQQRSGIHFPVRRCSNERLRMRWSKGARHLCNRHIASTHASAHIHSTTVIHSQITSTACCLPMPRCILP